MFNRFNYRKVYHWCFSFSCSWWSRLPLPTLLLATWNSKDWVKPAGWSWNGPMWVWYSSSWYHWWWQDASSGSINSQNFCQVSARPRPTSKPRVICYTRDIRIGHVSALWDAHVMAGMLFVQNTKGFSIWPAAQMMVSMGIMGLHRGWVTLPDLNLDTFWYLEL